jgi:pilus assembly protein Flp/PilA
MNKFFLATRDFLCEEEGVTIIEYALMAALIALGVVATVILVKDELKTTFNKIIGCLSNPSGAVCSPPAQ